MKTDHPIAFALSSALAILLVPQLAHSQNEALSPVDLVRRVVQNEANPPKSNTKFMYRDRKQTAHGSQTKLLVETSQTMAGLVVANNDQPLSPSEREVEQQRVERFVKDPEEIKKRAKREREDAEHTKRILQALPDAFIYEKDGVVAGTADLGKPGGQLVRLNFKPNPNYNPPGHEEQVLTGMSGYMLIDTSECRIAKIDGSLFKDVDFGWGILGRLDKGGTFMVQQADVGNGHWEVTRMRLNVDGKIMMFKSLLIRSDETFSDFQEVPANLTYAQGLQLLQKQQSELAENPPANFAKK